MGFFSHNLKAGRKIPEEQMEQLRKKSSNCSKEVPSNVMLSKYSKVIEESLFFLAPLFDGTRYDLWRAKIRHCLMSLIERNGN